jgi:hypothetical protein
MEGLWAKFRVVALLGAGSVIVHELRYVLAYGSDAGTALAEQGHSYTPTFEALIALLLGAVVVRFLLSVTRAFRGVAPARKPMTFRRTWLAASAALLVLYTLQEGFEGAFAPGHPGGVIGVYGNGGWTSVLLSLIVGALIAVLSVLARRTIELVAARLAPVLPKTARPYVAWIPLRASAGRRDVLAWNLAGRAPPAGSIPS